MRLIDEFVKKVLTEFGSFTINHQEPESQYTKYLYFLQGFVGKARYIYGAYSWNDEYFFSSISHNEPKLVAIVSDRIVYIVDEFMLDATPFHLQKSSNPLLPEHSKYFSFEVEEQTEYFANTIFPAFMDSIEKEDITDDEEKEELRKCARKGLLSPNPNQWLSSKAPTNIVNENDIANMLCGISDFKETMKKRLMEKQDYWKTQKARNLYVNETAQKKEGVEDWEINLAVILRSLNAKYVTVHFERNGLTTSGKMEPSRILRNLVDKSNISIYDFDTPQKGRTILSIYSSTQLTCKDISKITYGKQTLFDKHHEK